MSIPLGKLFEELVIHNVKEVSKATLGEGSFRHANDYQDGIQGTDFYVQKVPIDITLNVNEKDFVVKSNDYKIYGDYKVIFSIRGRNKRHKFNKPVLVIEFTTKSGININQDNLQDLVLTVKEKWGEILHLGLKWYDITKESRDVKAMTLYGRLTDTDRNTRELIEGINSIKQKYPIDKESDNVILLKKDFLFLINTAEKIGSHHDK